MLRALILALTLSPAAIGAPKRIVLIKADGLPAEVLARWLQASGPRSGQTELPWIQRVFIERGTWVRNFYTRGISLSAPSWSILDGGQHMPIRSNAEYDRYTLRVYDYLNFFPFYLSYARYHRVDMPAVEVMDELGLPLLIDRFEPTDRLLSPQLFQRSVRFHTLGQTIPQAIKARGPRQLFDEWQTGFEVTSSVGEQVERELLSQLAGPERNYFDYFFGDYDHVAHLAPDDVSTRDVLKKLDALIGRVWTAIEKSPRARDTLLVLVSDHGMNTEPAVYSQGYDLIRLFNSVQGGAHHVVTNRHPLTEFKIRGLDPFVSEVTTASPNSLYLRDQESRYPTVVLDLDGNERASVHLRNNDLNRIHILLQQLASEGSPAVRERVRAELEAILERRRPLWTRTVAELDEELAALARAIERQRLIASAQRRKFTRAEVAAEIEDKANRERVALANWERDLSGYRESANALRRLIEFKPGALEAGKFRVDQIVPHRFLGAGNTIHDLQNYVPGPGSRIDYFALLTAVRVRNNVQAEVGARPVDMVAVRAPCPPGLETCVFIYADEDHQALIQSRREAGALQIRYRPVAHLRQERAAPCSTASPAGPRGSRCVCLKIQNWRWRATGPHGYRNGTRIPNGLKPPIALCTRTALQASLNTSVRCLWARTRVCGETPARTPSCFAASRCASASLWKPTC